jgi:autotransporter-associated beta strand protein
VTFATALTSSGGTLTKFGSGTLTLSAVNTYTGVTNVLGGELDLNAVGGNAIAGNLTFLDYGTVKLLQSNQIASGKTLYLSTGNGTFDLQGFNQTLANVQLGSGSIVSSGGIMTSTAAFNMQNGFVSAVLCGSAGLNKNLGGTVTLSGANIYTGPTTITAGKLLLSGGDNRLPTTTSVVLTNTNGAILDLNGQNQTIASLSGGGANGGNVTLGGGTLTLDSTLNGSPDSIYSGVISGTCGKLTKLGPNMLTLSGANTYNGTTTISSGTLALAGKGQISATSQIVNNATFLIVDNIASHTLGAITGTGTTQLNDGAQLTATSVVQDILTIGSGATFTIQPIPGGPMALSENLTSVPEASTLILLGIGVVGLLGYIWRQRKHRA